MEKSYQIILVDDDCDLITCLAEFLEQALDIRCIQFNSLQALIAQQDLVLAPETVFALLDYNLGEGQPTGFEVFNWLQTIDFKGGVAFLTGHGRILPDLQGLNRNVGIVVLEKPTNLEALVGLIEGLGVRTHR